MSRNKVGRRNKRGRALHGILLLDKPAGGSSNHALQRAKRLFDAQKAGHTGSLDPLATGMLPVCFGEATKLSGFLLDANKAYETTMVLGVTTDSADSDGRVLETRAIPNELTDASLRAVCAEFVGQIQQIPPMVSALKVNGQRLYKLARAGIEVERKPRAVTIFSLEVLAFDGHSAQLAVRCSKGSYIRSLVSDIGERIGCGAHLNALRRCHVSPFENQNMWRFEQLEQLAAQNQQALDDCLLPLDAGLDHLPSAVLDPVAAAAFFSGQAVLPSSTAQPQIQPDEITERQSDIQAGKPAEIPAGNHAGLQAGIQAALPWRAYASDDGRLLGLAEMLDGGNLAPRRVIQWQ